MSGEGAAVVEPFDASAFRVAVVAASWHTTVMDGLVAKLQAYQLQDGGRDTVDANLDLGLPADARHYGAATQILKDLGVRTVRLMTNNPDKVTSLEDYGITVAERVPLTPHPNDHNLAYLLTKRDRMGHVLPDLENDVVTDLEEVRR